jgi:hypothetical protein
MTKIHKGLPEWQDAYDACKAILAKREHVQNARGPKP